MRHTIIVGSSKTGTTGLFYAVMRGLEATGAPLYGLYEVHDELRYDSLDKYAPERLVVAKLLVTNRDFDSEVAAAFENRLLIVRDPRDTLVSALLFAPVIAINKGVDDTRVAQFADLIRRKEQDPHSLSMQDLLTTGYALMGSTSRTSKSFTARFRKTVRYDDHVDSFVVKYESFVDGDLDDVEDFLSLELSTDTSAPSRTHIRRSGKYGGWRHWFVPADVAYFRPLLDPYMQRYGYADDWDLADEPHIDPETASGYVERSARSRREQATLTHSSAGNAAERLALLRGRADTGRTSYAVRLGEMLLADGSPAALAEAAERLTFAACTGSPKAMRLLAGCYRNGVGVARDTERARYWYRESRLLLGKPDPGPGSVPAPHAWRSLPRRVASRVRRAVRHRGD